jgi:hypothetical protein
MERIEKFCLVLRLGSGKYWVAETRNPRQYENSCKENTLKTKYIVKYGFVGIVNETSLSYEEVFGTYRILHGTNNVRGTKHPNENLNEERRISHDKKSLVVEIQSKESELGSNMSQLFQAVSNESQEYNVQTKFHAPKENLLASILNCERKTLYVLKLEHGRFYVGSTERNVEIRIQEHIDGKGSWVTKHFKFVHCIYTGPMLTTFDEDNMTESLMFALGSKGVKLVRGGSYSQFVLSDLQLNNLQRKFDHARNACLGCGKRGHYISECPDPKELECSRCYGKGHERMDCYVKYYQDGKRIL